MANEDPQNIHVSGYFRVSSAPLGTALPTDVLIPAVGPTPETSNLNAAFVNHGFTTPDGSLFRVSKTTEGIPVHQRPGIVRLLQTETLEQVQTVFREFNRQTWESAFGGGSFTVNAGVVKYEPPAAGYIDERAWVIDSIDGSNAFRLVIPRGTVSSGTEMSFARTAASDMPVTIDALIPAGGLSNFYVLTNAAALVSS